MHAERETISSGSAGTVPHGSHDAPGLYVHVPFCKTKCPYCDFYSSTESDEIPRWLDCIAREIHHYSGKFSRFDTVYIGGGTPSMLGENEITSLMHCITAVFGIAGDSEITIELNPDDVTPVKLAIYRELGIQRISLGVQSLDDPELRFLGRRHNAEQALDAIQDIRNAGFDNLGIDLIYGFAGQNIDNWKQTLQAALELSPEHLSCYQMTIEPDTQFGRMRAQGAVKEIGEELQRRFFLETAGFLRANGYIHYEISNFARSESLIARHNSKYWHHVPYLGLGPAAHSFKENKRWWNERSVAGYCRALESGTAPVAGSEQLTQEQLALERLFLGSRTREGFEIDPSAVGPGMQNSLNTLREKALVEIAGNRITPTLSGFAVADKIALLLA